MFYKLFEIKTLKVIWVQLFKTLTVIWVQLFKTLKVIWVQLFKTLKVIWVKLFTNADSSLETPWKGAVDNNLYNIKVHTKKHPGQQRQLLRCQLGSMFFGTPCILYLRQRLLSSSSSFSFSSFPPPSSTFSITRSSINSSGISSV